MKVQTRRLAMTAMVALCAAAAFAGAARAERPDDRPGLLGVGGAESSFRSEAVRPDDRAGLLGVGSADGSRAATVRPDDVVASAGLERDRRRSLLDRRTWLPLG